MISTVPDSNVKICRLCQKKTQLFLYPCAVTIFFRTIWWDLIIEHFCLEPYVEVATRMRYYTNIIIKKKKKKKKKSV